VRLAVAIMHAPWATERAAHVKRLARALDGHCEALTVVKDIDRLGVWPTARKAWGLAASYCTTHVAVMQDDALPCENFGSLMTGAIAANPHEVITLHSMSRRFVDEARERGSAWAWGPDAAYGQAMIMPRELVMEFLQWSERHIAPSFKHDDDRLGLWARCTGRGVYVTCPNLIDHAEPTRSLLGHSDCRRVARWFSDGSPVDWHRGLRNPVRATATLDLRHVLGASRTRPAPSPDPSKPRWNR